VNAANPDYANAGGVLFNKSMTTLIQYPCGLHALSYAIPSSVTAIGDEAFEECTSLNSITLPTGITSIGARAFAWCPGLTNIYCQGNLPGFDSTAIAGDSLSQMTFYYLPGTTGWSRLSAYGLRIVPWYLPNPLISNYGPGFGVQTNAFGFTISWATNLAVVVEACTNLANPVWQPVQTNTLVGGTAAFSDPLWNAHPSRFYRLLAAP
jgi:hypothetical protein